MVSDVKKYYNISTPYVDVDFDVGSYLFRNDIRYNLRAIRITESEDNLGMTIAIPSTIMIYTALLTEEDVLMIKLTFPDLSISEPKPETKIAVKKLVEKVLLL
jgi:hypothetical protein